MSAMRKKYCTKMKNYIQEKINQIKKQRNEEEKYKLEYLKSVQPLFDKFNNIFDSEFKENIGKLIKFLNENKEFDDCISINHLNSDGKFIVYNNYCEVRLILNIELKKIELMANNTNEVKIYQLDERGIKNAKLDLIDCITDLFSYPTNPEEKNLNRLY